MDDKANSDWASRAITYAKTPEDLQWALQVIRVDEDFALDGFESIDSHGGFTRYRPLVQEMMLGMLDKHPDFPPVPTGDDSVDYMNWCIRAKESQAPKPPTAPRVSKDEANVKARAYLIGHPEAKARDVATAIGCAVGLVSSLSAWQVIMEQRRLGRTPKRPTAVHLSHKMIASSPIGEKDEVLKQLMEEQENDGKTDGSIRPYSKMGQPRFRQRQNL